MDVSVVALSEQVVERDEIRCEVGKIQTKSPAWF